MSISAVIEGERKLFCALGANAGLGGAKVVAHQWWSAVLPNLTNILTVAQILVASATLVYMVIKIERILRNKKATE